MRKYAIITVIIGLILSVAAGIAPTLGQSTNGYGDVPQCTDAIADAGGICHGEPVADAGQSINRDLPECATPTANTDTTTCAVTTGTVPYIVTDDGEMFPSVDLPDCEFEDSDNCHWDAARMGNGMGTSFNVIDGNVFPSVD